MTIKKAVLIGSLLATTIALITIGVKTGSFDNKNKENYKPKILSKNSTTIRVDAEQVMPTSTSWLINENLSNASNLGETSIIFKTDFVGNAHAITSSTSYNFTNNTNNIFKSIHYYRNDLDGATDSTKGLILKFNNSNGNNYKFYYPDTNEWKILKNTSTTNSPVFLNSNNSRVITFQTTPSGNLLAWLNENATPLHNNNVIISNETGIVREITKQDTQLTLPQIINQDGLIKIYLDSGITNLNINGTNYENYNDAISLENKNIVITTTGTTTNQSGYIFKILYTNSLTPVAPYPDPSAPMYDVIDLKPLMLNILTMPFTFISQAFNVTLWPGTQYEFNISNFILSIIAIATILFIIKLFTSGFSIIGNYTNSRNDRSLKKSQTRLNKAKAKNIEKNTPRKSESAKPTKKE